jgi:hypothetical protein
MGDAAAAFQFLPEFKRYLERKFADDDHVLDNPPLQNAIHFRVRLSFVVVVLECGVADADSCSFAQAMCKALYFNRRFTHVSLTDYAVASTDGGLIMAAKELLPLNAPGAGDELSTIPKLPRSPRGTRSSLLGLKVSELNSLFVCACVCVASGRRGDRALEQDARDANC